MYTQAYLTHAIMCICFCFLLKYANIKHSDLIEMLNIQ